MQSQYDATISSDGEAVVAVATLVYDEYAMQNREHAETPDITPAPALEDIIDNYATQHGFQCDDRALEAAVRERFAAHGETMPSLAYAS